MKDNNDSKANKRQGKLGNHIKLAKDDSIQNHNERQKQPEKDLNWHELVHEEKSWPFLNE